MVRIYTITVTDKPSLIMSIRVVLQYITGMIVSVLPEKEGFQLIFKAELLPSRPDL
jgi:hypothetical protein